MARPFPVVTVDIDIYIYIYVALQQEKGVMKHVRETRNH